MMENFCPARLNKLTEEGEGSAQLSLEICGLKKNSEVKYVANVQLNENSDKEKFA